MSQLTVTILGSGTCVPSLDRSSCALLVETGESRVLFDCGPGTIRRLLEAGVTIFDLTHIFFTHFHPDHTGEIASLLFANKYAMPPQRTVPLALAGGKGFIRFYESFRQIYGHWISLDNDLLTLHEFQANGMDSRDYGDFSITTMPLAHRPESVGFRLSSGGVSMVYSGDTDVDDNLVALAADTALLVCEAAVPDAMKMPGHLTPSLAGAVAAKANVGELVLTHFYPVCDEVDLAKECRKTYKGRLHLATDLMQIEVMAS
ncbi:MAG: ribonuclease Z [Thermodesulfobacteriota bacterium]|nr:ribonuclease Z [Thermodesulfobacteriota bacterium]